MAKTLTSGARTAQVIPHPHARTEPVAQDLPRKRGRPPLNFVSLHSWKLRKRNAEMNEQLAQQRKVNELQELQAALDAAERAAYKLRVEIGYLKSQQRIAT